MFTWDRMTLDPLPHTTHTQINAKWIEGINVRAKTIKLRGKNTEGNLRDPDRPDSLNMASEVWSIKANTIINWTSFTLKTLHLKRKQWSSVG